MTRIFATAALAALTILGATFAAGVYAQAAEAGAMPQAVAVAAAA